MDASPETATANPWRPFALLAGVFFITTIDLTIVNVALPTIGRDLRFSATGLQWIATAYALTFGGFLLLGGRAADILGRRLLLLLGLLAFTVASLGCGLSTTPAPLIAARAVQGLGAAIMVPAALSIVMNLFGDGPERNRALGIWTGLGAAGATIGVVTGGLLTRYAGWQLIFYLNVPIGLLGLVLAPRIVPESRVESARREFDLLGAAAATTGLVALVDAVSEAPQHGWGSARTIAVLAAAVVLLSAFVAIERRAPAPVLPLSIVRSRTLLGANLAGGLLGASFYAFFFVGTLFMQQVLHYSALQTGLAWLATTVTSVALAGVSQALVTRVGPRPVMIVGLTAIAAGIVWATRAPADAQFLPDLAGPLAVAGAGTALSFIPISIAALAGVADHESGVASGLLNTSQQIGSALGIAIATSIAAGAASHAGPATGDLAALTRGFHHAFWALGAIALLALATAGALVRSKAPESGAQRAIAPDRRRAPREVS